MKFSALTLSDNIMANLQRLGYEEATPIQAKAIPIIQAGKDVVAAAQTGTGKTAAFTLPMLSSFPAEKVIPSRQVRALILVPTRELANQVLESVIAYGKNVPFKTMAVFGGVSLNPQMKKLQKGVDVLIATPGRLLDLYERRAMQFNQLELLVLDEVDRMLDMGFVHDVKKIAALLPNKRQTLLFSATISNEVKQLSKEFTHEPEIITVAPPNATAQKVEHWIHPVDKTKKPELLIHLIQKNQWQQVLVFSRTKHGADRLTKMLNQAKISALAIHGNKSQNAREKALRDFKNYKAQVLVATDVASRGINIKQLPHVVNFDLPSVPEDYVHRIGRTGRANEAGEAISLVCADEFRLLNAIELLLKQQLRRENVEGFEPKHNLPASHPNGQRKPNPNPPRYKAKKFDGKNKPQRSSAQKSRNFTQNREERSAENPRKTDGNNQKNTACKKQAWNQKTTQGCKQAEKPKRKYSHQKNSSEGRTHNVKHTHRKSSKTT